MPADVKVSRFSSYVTTGGISAGASYVANNISRYGQSAATIQQVTQRGKMGEAISGITKNTTRIYDNLVSGAKYRIPDGLTSTTLSEVKNYSGTLSYTAQLRDFVSYSQAHGLQMNLYTNAKLSGPRVRLLFETRLCIHMHTQSLILSYSFFIIFKTVFYWRHVFQRRMSSLSIIKHFDIPENIFSYFFHCLVLSSIYFFLF